MRATLLAILLVFMTGCASPSFVGTWHTDRLPKEKMPDNAVSSTLMISKEGSFSVTLDNTTGDIIRGANGTWSEMENGSIVMIPSDANRSQATATLLDKNTLLVADRGLAIRYQRKE